MGETMEGEEMRRETETKSQSKKIVNDWEVYTLNVPTNIIWREIVITTCTCVVWWQNFPGERTDINNIFTGCVTGGFYFW